MDIRGWPGPDDKPIECSESISQHEAFRQTLRDHFYWKRARASFPLRTIEDEQCLEYRQLEKAESASYDALVTVIDAYCAYQNTQMFLPKKTQADHETG